MPSTETRDRILLGFALLALLVLAYAVVVANDVVVWVSIVVPLVALYLFWRLVRAHERIAEALE